MKQNPILPLRKYFSKSKSAFKKRHSFIARILYFHLLDSFCGDKHELNVESRMPVLFVFVLAIGIAFPVSTMVED